MIEKKMYDKVQAELAKKQEEDNAFKREVQIRTAQREKYLEDERRKLIAENEIRLQTAHEARVDAEKQAKTVSVQAMVGAASQTNMKQPQETQAQET